MVTEDALDKHREQGVEIALRERVVEEGYEVNQVVEEIWQVQSGCHPSESVENPVEVDLNSLTKDVISHGHL